MMMRIYSAICLVSVVVIILAIIGSPCVCAETQQPLWEQYVDAGSKCVGSHDWEKMKQYYDGAISEFQRLAQTNSSAKFTLAQQQKVRQFAHDLCALESLELMRANHAGIIKSIPSRAEQKRTAQPRIEELGNPEEKVLKAWPLRFQRLETAFQHLFGTEADATKKVGELRMDAEERLAVFLKDSQLSKAKLK